MEKGRQMHLDTDPLIVKQIFVLAPVTDLSTQPEP